MRILACLVVVGLFLGFGVPLPAFGILLVIITISYALVGGSDLSWAGRLYDLILASVALQFGYFLTILVRTLIVAKSATKRESGSRTSTPKREYDRASLELSNFSKSHSTYSVEQQRKLALERRDEITSALAITNGAILEKQSQAAKLQDTLVQLKRHVGFPSRCVPKYNPPPAADADRSADLPSGDSPLLLVRVYQDTAQSLVTLNAGIAGLRALEENQRAALASVDGELASLSSIGAEFDRLKREVDQAAAYLKAHTKRAGSTRKGTSARN